MVEKPAQAKRNPPDVMTIKEAAALLGVSAITLRRWDSSGKLRPHRHPVNGFRVYKRTAVMKLRKQIEGSHRAH